MRACAGATGAALGHDVEESVSDHQTEMFDAVSAKGWRETPSGMAHWLGTGPAGRTCRECEFFKWHGRYASSGGSHTKGELKPAKCKKYKDLMRQWGDPLKHHLRACKYFEETASPPNAVVR